MARLALPMLQHRRCLLLACTKPGAIACLCCRSAESEEVGKGSFQELDQLEAVCPFCKFTAKARAPGDIPALLQQALQARTAHLLAKLAAYSALCLFCKFTAKARVPGDIPALLQQALQVAHLLAELAADSAVCLFCKSTAKARAPGNVPALLQQGLQVCTAHLLAMLGAQSTVGGPVLVLQTLALPALSHAGPEHGQSACDTGRD